MASTRICGTSRYTFAAGTLLVSDLIAGLVGLSGCGKPNQVTDEPVASATDPQHPSSPEVQFPTQGDTTKSSLSNLPLREYRLDLQGEMERVDPIKDGWDTEHFSDRVSIELKKMKTLFVRRTVTKEIPHLHHSFECSALRPDSLEEVTPDSPVLVRRGRLSESDPAKDVGEAGLKTAVARAIRGLPTQAAIDMEAKIIDVRLDGQTGMTRLRVQVNARGDAVSVQQTAEWNCAWNWDEKDDVELKSIRLESYEEASTRELPALFADLTVAVVGSDPAYRNQLAFGIDHWRERLDWRFGAEIVGAHGLAIGDVNGDGWEDLFVCETGGLPNRLYVQQADGTCSDQSANAAIDYLEPTHSVLLIDLDNDGDPDLVMTSGRYLLLFENDGVGRFARKSIHQSNSMARSMAAADYDLDGDLDIYVCGYFSRESGADQVGLGKPLPYHDANNGVRNYLMSNDGNWRFSDVTDRVGLDQNNCRFSYAAAWNDYDQDGDPDLYVANDFGRNNLYRNDRGQFVDVAAEAGVEDISAGMSACWGDYNRDGWMDIYVGNMFSSAGGRIAYQRNFNSAADQGTREQFQRHARGNSLFENTKDGTFRDVTLTAGVSMGRWAWSSNFADIDNDGWEDLIIGNGMVTSVTDTGDL